MTRHEWLLERKKGIGSSDAPIIMGVSPWKNVVDLYNDKISNSVDETTNYVQERGNRMEPRIRSLYEMISGQSFPADLVRMEELPWMMASLDGISEDRKSIIEIKVSGKADWESGFVPPKYYPQVQHAMLVANADRCFYLSYLYSKKEPIVLSVEHLVVLEAFPDREYQREMFDKEMHFWKQNVEKRIPPL